MFAAFFFGAQQGILFGRRWQKLEQKAIDLEKKIYSYEKDELDTLAARLSPQIRILMQRLRDELEDLEYLLGNDDDVNRDTEFEASVYRLNVYEKLLDDLNRVHELRL